METIAYRSESSLIAAVENGDLSAGIVVPEDIDDRLSSGDQVEVGLVTRNDGSGPRLAPVVDRAVSDQSAPIDLERFVTDKGLAPDRAAEAIVRARGQAAKITVSEEAVGEQLFEAGIGQFAVGASGQIVLFMFLSALAWSVAVIQTRNLGLTTRMLSTPTSASTVVAGETLGRFLLVLFQGFYIMFATWAIFRVDWGDPIAAVAIMIVFSLVGAGAALLFGTLFKNDQQAGGFGVMIGLGMAAIGGSMLPIELFSDTLKTASRFTTYFQNVLWAPSG